MRGGLSDHWVVVVVAALGCVRPAAGRLVLPARAPMGFNSFDSYGQGRMNETVALRLADRMAEELLPLGYEYFVIDGGWSVSYDAAGGTVQHLDEFGRPVAAPDRYPQGLRWLGCEVRRRGLKFGLWVIRGAHETALSRPVHGAPTVTVGSIVDTASLGGGPNGSCLWQSEWLGVNLSLPGALDYYRGQVAKLIDDYEVDFIKADCFFCKPCYTDEMTAFSTAVHESTNRDVGLSLSPGGGSTVADGEWVAGQKGPSVVLSSCDDDGHPAGKLKHGAASHVGPIASMYRVVTDFHGGWAGWGGLQQALFIIGNFSALAGANHTWPDPDMLPLKASWWGDDDVERRDRGATIATAWFMSGAPLMYAGTLPLDATTCAFLTDETALAVHAAPAPMEVVAYSGACACRGLPSGCTLITDQGAPPCVATWRRRVGDAGATAIGLINMGENGTDRVLETLVRDLLTPGHYRARDIWSRSDLGSFHKKASTDSNDGTRTVHLRPHASLFLFFDPLPPSDDDDDDVGDAALGGGTGPTGARGVEAQ